VSRERGRARVVGRQSAVVSGGLVGLVAVGGLAAHPVAAQVRREASLQGVVTTAAPTAVTAGPGFAWRVGTRDRVAIWAGAGGAGGGFAARGEATYHFLLNPTSQGAGVYLGGGVATAYDQAWRGLLIGVVGVESSPGGRGGWFAEAGFGGGVRMAAGFRWRRS
jgi:hypothetical protein